MTDLGSSRRLALAVHERVRFVLVRPHYPENLGASARAIKTMGFSELVLVRPSRLCTKEHEMAFKMAVKSWDVLDRTTVYASVAEAIEGCSMVAATTARRGLRGVLTPRSLMPELMEAIERNGRAAVLFGNEKTGLSREDSSVATHFVRIPMAADQPSINLAQSVQLVAYELLLAALDRRRGGEEEP